MQHKECCVLQCSSCFIFFIRSRLQRKFIMIVCNYVLTFDRTIAIYKVDDSDVIGNEGEVVYKRSQDGVMIFTHHYNNFISQIWFKDRQDSRAIDILLNDTRSKKLIQKRMKESWKQEWKTNISSRRYNKRRKTVTKYLTRYLESFECSKSTVSRLTNVLRRDFHIYTLQEFINTPVSLIELKEQRGIGIKTVELYYKAYYHAKTLKNNVG